MRDSENDDDIALLQACLTTQAAITAAALDGRGPNGFLQAVTDQLVGSLEARAGGFFVESDGVMSLAVGAGWLPHIQQTSLPDLSLAPDATATPVADVTGLVESRLLRSHDLSSGLVCPVTMPNGDRAALAVFGGPHVAHPAAASLLTTAAGTVAAGLGRRHLEDQLIAGERRLVEAQELAHLGSYDWNILTDTNVWSDELFRIYGVEPGAFQPSYDEFLARVHPDDRDAVMAAHKLAFETHDAWQIRERIVRPDGSVRILATTGEVVVDDSGTPVRMRGICIDMTDRLEADQRRAELDRAHERRRQALEINDTVVQGLTSVVWAIEAGALDAATLAAIETLESARGMMSRLLEGQSGVDLDDLRRTSAATGPLAGQWTPAVTPGRSLGHTRVLIADDAPDIRLLLRLQLELRGDCELVGEAATGPEAVEVAARTQPDVVLLDVAMPGGSGIEAIPEIRRVAPDASIVILSGFSSNDLEAMALAAGAVGYVEKAAISDLFDTLEAELPDLFSGPSTLEPSGN